MMTIWKIHGFRDFADSFRAETGHRVSPSHSNIYLFSIGVPNSDPNFPATRRRKSLCQPVFGGAQLSHWLRQPISIRRVPPRHEGVPENVRAFVVKY